MRYLHVDKDTVDWWPFNGSFGIQLGDSFDFTSWEEEKHSYKERWDQSLQEVESLSLDVTLGDVRIERGKENKITFLDIRKEKVNIKQEKGNVTVTVDNPDISKGNRNRNDTIIVTLKDKQYERISVEDKLGDIQLKNLSAKHITIEEKLGDITLEHIVSKDLAIAQSAGDIEVDGQLYGNSVVKSSMGDITMFAEIRRIIATGLKIQWEIHRSKTGNGSCHVMQRKEIDRVTTTFSYTAVWGISICSLKDE